jgi:Methyltransferase FkbM domain
MLITIFGSCRQESVYKLNNATVTGIRDNVSYTHYTKEILELIKFCKYGHISPEDTVTTFRTPILYNRKLYFNEILKNNFYNTNVFVLEISGRKSYEYNRKYVHHILYDNEKYNKNYKDKINVTFQSDEEIENDIVKIKKELNRPIVIVGHVSARNDGGRFDLLCILEKICLNHNILFINPAKEFLKLGQKVELLMEPDLTHYNEMGHNVIQEVYNRYIHLASLACGYFRIYNTEYKKIRVGSKNDGGYVIAENLNIKYNLLLSCGISDDITFENCFIEKYNASCYAFDGTIDYLPSNANKNIIFIKKNISNKETSKTTNLLSYIENNENIFLKMDIETNEYQWLEIMSYDHLNKINQIVIEFHYSHQNNNEHLDSIFEKLSFPISLTRRIECLKKLEETHYLVHLHPNNGCGTINFNGIQIPNVYECTYIKKNLCKKISYSSNKIPDPVLDSKNVPTKEDICLESYPFVFSFY